MKPTLFLTVIALTIHFGLSSSSLSKKSSRYKVVTYHEEEAPTAIKSKEVNLETVNKVLSCYYNVPSMYDTPFPVFPEQIDPFLCTHIMIAFGQVENCTLIPGEARDIEFYNRTIKLKVKNPNLKILISVGGDLKNLDKSFAIMMASNVSRMLFIKNSISFMDLYGFDGFDLDWEFPGFHSDDVPGDRNQKTQLSDFFKEFRQHLNSSVSKKYLLTAAVGARKSTIDISYDIRSIASSLDFINLMTYDFHYYSPLTPLSGPNSPLHALSSEIGYLGTMNAAWAANYWFQNGMPANKILLGLPTYGRTFRLVDEQYHGYYSVVSGVASVGSNGYISYSDVCTFLEQNGTKVVFDAESREPYAFNGRDWITFSNEQSTKEKVDFVNEMNFLGVTVYNINSDDAWKSCNKSKTIFPIIQTAKEILTQP